MAPKQFVYDDAMDSAELCDGDRSSGKNEYVYSQGGDSRSSPNPHFASRGPAASAEPLSSADAPSRHNRSHQHPQGSSVKLYVLLLRPCDKIFELVQVDLPQSGINLGDLLYLISGSATEPKLGNQRHCALLRSSDGAEFADLRWRATASMLFSSLGGNKNEILVAVPEGCAIDKCRQLSDKILRNPKMVKLLKRKDPLKPKSGGGRSSRSKASSSSSSSSSSSRGSRSGSGMGVGGSPSGMGRRKRSSGSIGACVPPTVMECDEEDTVPDSLRRGNVISVDNDEASEIETIASLLSRDATAERRRREEEQRIRRQTEENNRREAEERTKRDAEGRIRKEIAEKARQRALEENERDERAERERKGREEEDEQRRMERESNRVEEMTRRVREGNGWGVGCPPSPIQDSRVSQTKPLRSPTEGELSINDVAVDKEDEVSALEPPTAIEKSSKGSKGFEMFIFGMVSSAFMVLLSVRIMSAHMLSASHHSDAVYAPTHVTRLAPQQVMQEELEEDQPCGFFFVLQFLVLFFLLNRGQRWFRRRQKRMKQLTMIPRRESSSNLSALSRVSSRAKLSTTNGTAMRMDAGFRSESTTRYHGESWRKVANL